MFSNCPHCHHRLHSSESRKKLSFHGYYRRLSDGKKLRRYLCHNCKKTFSDGTNDLCYNQNKRHKNHPLFELLSSSMTQRRAARILGINRKTVARKLIFLSEHAKNLLQMMNEVAPVVHEMQFDDLETSEHTKMKPLSVTLAVEKGTRRILGFEVASMPAKGLLSEKALKKYGKRKDERKIKRKRLFEKLSAFVHPRAEIESDENPYYMADVKKYFSRATYRQYKGRDPRTAGLGELKKGGWDPLFSLNHTCAMLRANISRLVRKTWATTKKAENLERHIYLYAIYHNLNLKRQTPMYKRNSLRIELS